MLGCAVVNGQHFDSDEPIHIPNLDVALQPLRFMEFSLEQVQQTTLMDPIGRCVVVTLPAPERYAVNKLLIIGERTGAFRVKISKDLAQAAALVAHFKTHDPNALAAAWQDALSRGPGWLQRAMGGRAAIGSGGYVKVAVIGLSAVLLASSS
jgi:hypothetical protein